MENLSFGNPPETKFYGAKKKHFVYVFSTLAFFGVFYYFILSSPSDFPINTTVNVERGMSLGTISRILKDGGVIRSKAAFEFFVIALGREKHIKPAYYFFEESMPVFSVAWRLGGGRFYIAPTRVTIPEGFTSEEIAEAFVKKLPNFSKTEFYEIAKGKEGYLFPDTYFFLNTDGAEEAVESMEENFEKKIEPLLGDIALSGRTLDEIITMASLIEGEAGGDQDRALISGILWKRIRLGMRLQADAAPITYKEADLPEEPIGNPGSDAIKAAIFPYASPYLYYLHDADGNIHYARTLAEHNSNIRKYLKD